MQVLVLYTLQLLVTAGSEGPHSCSIQHFVVTAEVGVDPFGILNVL